MAHEAARIGHHGHVAGLALAGALSTAISEGALRANAIRVAQGDAKAARSLVRAVRTSRAEAEALRAELAAMRDRALKAEGALLRLARG